MIWVGLYCLHMFHKMDCMFSLFLKDQFSRLFFVGIHVLSYLVKQAISKNSVQAVSLSMHSLFVYIVIFVLSNLKITYFGYTNQYPTGFDYKRSRLGRQRETE